MIVSVLQMILPIILMLSLGMLCKKKGILSAEGLAGVRSVVSDICLPVVLFNAFFTAKYSLTVLITFVVVYIGFGIALGCGFALRKLVGSHGRFFPFLLTSAEGGMLGYALYGMLMGEQSGFATADLGQTVFAYTCFLGALLLSDGGKPTPKMLISNIVTNKCCIGMALGILLGALGVGEMVLTSEFGSVVTSVISMVTSPTGALVLLVVGYDLEMDTAILKPVITTVICRLVVMAALLGLVSLVIFSIVPFDKSLFIALMVMYSLPAPFIIPMFANVGEEGKYISTSLSLHTICTIALFALISAFVFM